MKTSANKAAAEGITRGDRLRSAGELEGAINAYLLAATQGHPVPASLCLSLARAYLHLNNIPEAIRWAVAVVDAGDDFTSWVSAASLIEKATDWKIEHAHRRARVAIAGSFTTLQLRTILPLVGLRHGIEFTIWEAPYGHYRQELLSPGSALYRSQPDFIILAVHEGELTLPPLSSDIEADLAHEMTRWTSLWDLTSRHSSARVVQFNFALPAEAPFGHLGARLPGSRYGMIQTLNSRLGAAAGSKVDLVDCERLSALVGKEQWTDPRYWHISKQAVALSALPLLARHITAVIGAQLGLSRKVLVLDLDGTLWGGVIGEDGLAGIKLGGDQTGEAFLAFQDYIRQLKSKGVILAVCSKNNEADAREPFEQHPEMKLKLDDFAVFVANWEPKAENIVRIAETLNIGLDALVFVDDSPVECASIRQALPQVDVVVLPPDPAYYTRALSHYLMFETAIFTNEDAQRTEQYRARTLARRLEKTVSSLDELWESLEMTATIAPFDDFNLPRIVQLIGKTNQFNLTTRRHARAQIEDFMRKPDCIHFFLRLRDRFADHGIVALMIALKRGSALEIETWLMSCRVIGRTVENTMFAHLCAQATQRGTSTIRGLYYPTEKNQLVKDLYSRLGFSRAEDVVGGIAWNYDLEAQGLISNDFIKVEKPGENNGRYSRAVGAAL